MPHGEVPLVNAEHKEAVCTVLGLPSPAAMDIVGQEIPSNHPSHTHTVDEDGWSLTNAGGWEGDSRRRNAHNEMEGVMADSLTEGGAPVYRGDGTKTRLARGLPPGGGRTRFQSEPPRGELLKGIMPDLVVSIGDGDELGDAKGPSDVWCDVKTLGHRATYLRQGDTQGHAVRTRQREVVDEYVKRAERADNTFFRNDPSTPFKHMLNGLPRVKGLVFGMFGEWSQDVAQLLKLAAGNLAARWAALNGLSAEDALQACTWDLKRRWSLTALRANARVRIECAHHVKYSAAGSQRAPRSVGGTHAGWLARRPRS